MNVQSLREAVNEVLSIPKYKEGIRKINDSLLACGRPKEAIKVIDSILSRVVK